MEEHGYRKSEGYVIKTIEIMTDIKILIKLIGKYLLTSGAGLSRCFRKQKTGILPPK